MTRKIARQSELTPLKTIDEYLWNERLGVTQLPPADMSQGPPQTSSLPPQSSQAPAMDYDSSNAQSDMFGSGVSGEGQLIAPQAPNATPASVPARSKAASQNSPLSLAEHLMDDHGMLNELIRDHDENVKLHDQEHRDWPNSGGHKHSSKVTAVSTLYGDVDPTPTTGEKSSGGLQVQPPNEPNKPSIEPEGAEGAESAAGGLAADVGEAASIAALASKYKIGSVLDPADNLKFAKYHYIRKEGDQYCIWQKNTGKTLSCHSSKEKAEASFRAMEMSKHS